MIYKKCSLCGQPLYEEHDTIYVCIRALVKRVDSLEDELLARKLELGLARSSDPGSGLDSKPPKSLNSIAESLKGE